MNPDRPQGRCSSHPIAVMARQDGIRCRAHEPTKPHATNPPFRPNPKQNGEATGTANFAEPGYECTWMEHQSPKGKGLDIA